ncbi:hypothetical protein FRB91_011896 [Serendipita sp. 411]|nr:hypothetical protein FRC15_005521 [Serendipita sp. 397]KAG8771552.1 hypothetical protein FRC16_005904 [Serendipita sp. 398]KAG8847328.1 hypothetical protein FRB91_011896 [Serendipita sp. 411]KAG8855560.1 hypothetical protein FRC20_000746 [Serendipita sp. 405]KAG9044150.1 hypothetical protein FS842_001566 [Serendipita sp. 407]
MPRSRRLPPRTISFLETHHAYISPPLPENGGLPTIIVTPAESACSSDFEIHFYSPKPTQTTFQSLSFVRRLGASRFQGSDELSEQDDEEKGSESKGGFLPRIKSLFRSATFFGQGQVREREVTEKDLYEASGHDSRAGADLPRSTIRQSRWAGHNAYVSLPSSEEGNNVPDIEQVKEEDYEQDADVLESADIHGVPTISEQEWQAAIMIGDHHHHYQHCGRIDGPLMGSGDSTAPELILGGGQRRPFLMTRRARTCALFIIPIALLALHLIHHQFAWLLVSSESGGDARWTEDPPTPLSGPSF